MNKAFEELDSYLNNSPDNMIDKIDNTRYNQVLKLRNEAAERGIEMTPREVLDLIKLLKMAAS